MKRFWKRKLRQLARIQNFGINSRRCACRAVLQQLRNEGGEIDVSILLVAADTARISESRDPFDPTVAHPKRKCPFAAETNSDHPGCLPGFR
jgi:hypothetical protein